MAFWAPSRSSTGMTSSARFIAASICACSVALARGLDLVPGMLAEGTQKAMQALHTRAGEKS